MDKKIIKYKTKKNKLENEILELLNRKKENYENDIANSNNNHMIVEFIKNYLNELKSGDENNNKKIIIIVSGNYSVGKTTFVSNLENYILKISDNILNTLGNNLISNISFDNCMLFNNGIFEIKNKITIIKVTNHNLAYLNDKINSNIDNINILNIKIITKDKNSLKNKYINKIISDIKNNTSYFIKNLSTNNNINSDIQNNIQNNIQLLKSKKSIYSDNDFIFLNQVVNDVFNFKYDVVTNFDEKTNCELNFENITTFYL